MTGPHAIDPERLLAETRWLRGLARQLVGDGDAADDVVQETWLAVLRSPPAAGGPGGLRGWLAQVARNAARMRQRGEARRREREHLVAARHASGDDANQPLVAQQQLLAEVMALEPDDRRVVTMRYLEELPPRVIAQRLGTTSAAVRSRLSRALAALRARLAPGGDRGSLLLALSPLLPGGAAATTSTLLFGTMLMKGKMLVGVAAALLVAIGSWLWWPDPALPGSVQAGDRVGVVSAAVDVALPRGGAAAEVTPAADRVSVASSPGAFADVPAGVTEGRLIVTARCVDERGQPLPGARVSSTLSGRPFALADPDGRVRLEMVWPVKRAPGAGSWLQVEASAQGRVVLSRERDVSPRGGEMALGEFVLAPAGGLTGLVRDARGGAAAGVHVWVAQAVTPLGGEAEQLRRAFGGPHFRRLADEVQAAVTTDANGRYRFDALPCLEASVIVEPKRAPCSYSAPVRIVAGQVVEVPPIVIDEPSADARIAGVVLDADGDSIAGMAVQLMPNRSGRNGNTLDQQQTGGDGTFEFVVPPGRQFTVVVMGTGRDGRRRTLHDVASGSSGLRVEFATPRVLQLLVTGPEGEILQPSGVTGLSADGFGMLLATRPGADGAEQRLLPDETFSLLIAAKGYRSKTVGPFEPAKVDRIEVQLEKAMSLSGRVVAGGEPLPGAKVHVHRLDERQPFHRFAPGVFTRVTMASPQVVVCDADGGFELSVQLDGDYVVHAEADGWARGSSDAVALRDGAAVGPPVEIVLSRPASIDVQVLVGDGDSVEAQVIAATTGDGHVEVATTDAEGRARFAGLAPGGWQVRACAVADERWLRQARTWPERSITALPVDLVLAEGVDATFSLDLRSRSAAELVGEFVVEGLVAAKARVSIWRDGTYLQQPVDGDGRFAVRTAVGANKLFGFVELPGGARLELHRPVELQAGRNEVSLRLPSGGLEVRGLVATPLTEYGERVNGYALVWPAQDGVECTCRFDPGADGTWRFEHLPIGPFELRRQGRAGQQVSQWEVLSRGEVAAGQWRTLDGR